MAYTSSQYKKKLAIIVSVLFFIPLIAISPHCTVHNALTTCRDEVVKYYTQGQYDSELEKTAQEVIRLLRRTCPQSGKKAAIVFDIDETVLSNVAPILRQQVTSQYDAPKWFMKEESPAIRAMKKVYYAARSLGYIPFFITGRGADLKEATRDNLHKQGFFGFKDLILRPLTYKETSNVPFKSSARKAIKDRGYDILFNIGDQWSDLLGERSEYSVKLPNYLYYTP